MKNLKKWAIANKKQILLHFGVFLIMLVLARANVMHILYPFAFSFLFALIYLNKNAVLLCIFYLLTSLLYSFTLQNLIISVSVVSFAILLYLIFKISKKKMPFFVALIFCALSQVGFLYFNIYSTKQIIISLVSIVVGLCFMYIVVVAFGALFYRGLQSRFTLDESICFGIFLIAFFSGIAGVFVGMVNLSYLMVIFFLACMSRILTKSATIYFSALAGLGFSFVNANVTFIAVFVTFGLIFSCFAQNSRFFPAVLAALADLVFGMFLNAYPVYNYVCLLATLCCLFLFLCVQSKLFVYLQGFGFDYDGNLVSEYLISGRREELKSRLTGMAQLFRSMQVEYRNLSIGKVNKDEYCQMLTNEIESRICCACINKNNCSENAQIHSAIYQLIDFGMEKGKVTILDANNLLTGSCDKLGVLIGEVNEALKLYFKYQEQVASSDNGKMLVSAQMGATGKIFSELALAISEDEIFDKKQAKAVLDQLTADKVVVNECEVISGNSGVKKVVLAVRNSDIVNPKISEDLRTVLKMSMVLIRQTFARLSGWSILQFEPADKYSLAIGFAQKSVDGLSGDVYSYKKIGSGRYLFAIADGKGHGVKANQISSSALSIVESFYKSQFSSETIVHSVNKLLIPAGEENFTTLDAVVVDLSSGMADFVKIGASVSLIKQKNQCAVVSCSSLPLGVMEKIYPTVEKKVLQVGDIVVIASDGIVDAFSSPENFADFVNNEMFINVQMLADSILEEAESRTAHPDDMTVIVFKLNQNFA